MTLGVEGAARPGSLEVSRLDFSFRPRLEVIFTHGLMTDTKDVNVEVRGEDIVITAPGTDHLVIYSKRDGSVELSARRLFGPLEFRTGM